MAEEKKANEGNKSNTKSTVFFVLGGPGAGKGTHCNRLTNEFGLIHLCVGDLLRQEIDNESKDAQLIKTHMIEGKLVPVIITINIIKKAMEKHNIGSLFIIDGFPRNSDNLCEWNKLMNDYTYVPFLLYLQCNEKQMSKRILSRKRADDNLETFKKRYKIFINDTMPIIEQYKQLNKCKKVNTGSDIDIVYEKIRKIFVKYFKDIERLQKRKEKDIKRAERQQIKKQKDIEKQQRKKDKEERKKQREKDKQNKINNTRGKNKNISVNNEVINNYENSKDKEKCWLTDWDIVGNKPYVPSYNNYNNNYNSNYTYTKDSSGCIDSDGLVLMANGQRKKVCDIKSGEYVRSFPNCVSMVECVMISKIGKEIKMVKLENSNDGTHFWITYKHPILVDNDTVMIDHDICNNLSVDSLDVDVMSKYNLKWVFPKTICGQELKFEYVVYNFLLDSNHTINVNGYWCVTLGDDYDKGDGIGHELWGNSVAVRKFLNHKSKD